MLINENYKQILTSKEGPLKKKGMFRDENEKQVRTYAVAVSTGELSNDR